ncbi:hypothetical protein FO440_20300 [Mucilaginibacter corticis]|uniref:Uncharacterized protein n=1 Tax=Mucilaginibacter corticis TaxID=2597670 RepID=A0A556MFZ5_9SPHI|nr:hypothetical protein [Mucilaginibacter corticis]TSJ38847.1 hypothetical protein FO440_20300 [Mucilaginibacter corticis]
MQSPTPTDQLKQVKTSIFINLAMSVYAVCTLLRALQTHVFWRILSSAVGSVFFVAMVVILVQKMIKLRKAD